MKNVSTLKNVEVARYHDCILIYLISDYSSALIVIQLTVQL